MKGVDAILAKHAWLDPQRVGALGASYGGWMVCIPLSHRHPLISSILLLDELDKWPHRQCVSLSLSLSLCYFANTLHNYYWKDLNVWLPMMDSLISIRFIMAAKNYGSLRYA